MLCIILHVYSIVAISHCGNSISVSLFSEDGVLDQRTGMIGTTTPADNKEVLVILCGMKSAD